MTHILQKAWRHRERLGLDLAMAALCAVALAKGIQTTADLQWPYDVDQDRDTGLAQAILDHHYGADDLYRGETIWYNPLVAILIASLSRATGLPAHVVTAQGGTYLNLLAPIAFYFLVTYLFDRWVGLAATAAFLFAPIGNAPSWVAASYSPWLFTQNFVQSLFYLTLLASCKALQSNQSRWYVIVGVLLGITFLGHTAPAVMLGIIMVIAGMKSLFHQGKAGWIPIFYSRKVRGLGVVFVVAFVVSLPLTFSILFHYHLRILNPVATNWIFPILAVDSSSAFILTWLSWFSAVAGIGLLVLIIKDPPSQHARTVLLSWFFICCTALALNYVQQLISPQLHLMPVPVHHFLFFLKAIEDILFGIGLVFACRFLARNLRSKLFRKSAAWDTGSTHLRDRTEVVLIATGIAVFLVLAFPAYRTRFDFTAARAEALEIQQQKPRIDAYHWILSNTKPDDVFLSMVGDADLRIVAPAGRKVVATCVPEFSNPYVAWQPRHDLAAFMRKKLESHSADALATLEHNHVDYIMSSSAAADWLEYYSPFLSAEFAEDEILIYRVRTQ